MPRRSTRESWDAWCLTIGVRIFAVDHGDGGSGGSSVSGVSNVSEPAAPRAFTWLVGVLLAAAWACLCYVQVVLVGSRLFSGPTETVLVWNQLAAVALVYLPIGLAAVAVWLTRGKPLGFVALVHVVATYLSVMFWVM